MIKYLRLNTHQFLLSFVVLCLFASAVRGQYADSTFNSYYKSLLKRSNAATSSQITNLKSFIIEHPDFAPAYLDLVDKAVMANLSAEAGRFLRKLSQAASSPAVAAWALARIYEKKMMPDSAFSEFLHAFNAGMNSFDFYNDLLRFDVENNNRFSVLSIILNSRIPEEYKIFSTASSLYYNGSYAESNNLLQSLDAPEEEKIIQYFKACNEIYLHNFQESENAVLKALARAKLQGDLKSKAIMLNFLFPIYWASDKAKAREALRQANEIAQKIDDMHLQARVALSLSYLTSVDGSPRDAAKGYLAAASTFKSFSDYRRAARALSNASEALYTVSRYSQALDAILQSLELYKKIGDHYESIMALTTIAKIYGKLNQHKISLHYLDQAQQIAEAFHYTKQIAEISANQQKILAVIAPKQKAVSIYKKLLADVKTNGASINPGYCYWMLASACLDLHDIKNAQKYFSRALAWTKKNGPLYYEAWALAGLIRAKNINNEAVSDQDFEKLLSYSRRVADRRLESTTFYELGEYSKNQKSLHKAIVNYKKAIQINESIRDSLVTDVFRMGLMTNQLSAYDRLAEIYVELFRRQNNPVFIDSVFQYEEMHRARSLKDELEQKIKTTEVVNPSRGYQNAVVQLRKKQLEIRRLKNKNIPDSLVQKVLAQYTADKFELLTEKIEYAHHLADSSAPPQYIPLTLQQLQGSLHDQTVLLYHLVGPACFVLAINSDSVNIVQLATECRSVKEAVESIIAPMHNVSGASVSETPFYAQQAHQLYMQLFQPVENQFPLHHEIYILSQDELATLPFEMLLSKNPPKPVYTPRDEPVYSADFLVNDYTFFYGPSTIELVQRNQKKRRPKMLVMANPFAGEPATSPDFTLRFRTGWQFDDLPYARREALKIKDCFRGAAVKLGRSASEHFFKNNADRFDIIHIATHAFADLDFEQFSGLALAISSDSTEDGLLQGYEITSSSLACDLVVLSACETGRGKKVSGEGVLALPRQFLLAGAHSVVMSQWKVDDRFTALMMPLFYENYLHSTMNKAAALWKAKIDILQKQEQYQNIHYQHPFFWAAFTFYGDSGQPHPPYRAALMSRFTASLAALGAFGLLLLIIVWRRHKVRSTERT